MGSVTAATPASGSELVIGLVAAVGTEHDRLTEYLEEILKTFKYRVEIIRLAALLHAFPRYKKLPSTPIDDYIHSHQRAGDEFRELMERHDALAILGLGEIRRKRIDLSGDENKVVPRCAYIIRSLKTPEEVQTLREVYGNAFLLIGSSAPYELRRKYLASKIASSRHSFQTDQYLPRAEELIQRDQEEVDEEFGQNLRNAFHLSDVFVDCSDNPRLHSSLERVINLVFGNTFRTPTRDEYAMFHARGAALRSAELGRQVGATVTTPDGDIIAVGTNEVPRAGGGLYWEGDPNDQREFLLGEDSNDVHKRKLLEDLLSRLKDDGWLASGKEKLTIAELTSLALDPAKSQKTSAAQLTHLIEFVRAVHAEMAAISDAARRGVSIAGSTMYVTTFPCHLCARMIVAAGIKRVVYIEPYAKSLALQLYPDSIAVDTSASGDGQICFQPFVGIAPRKYMELFAMLDRKRKGKVVAFDPPNALPRLTGSPRSYLQSEKKFISDLQTIIEEKQMMIEQQEFPYDKA